MAAGSSLKSSNDGQVIADTVLQTHPPEQRPFAAKR